MGCRDERSVKNAWSKWSVVTTVRKIPYGGAWSGLVAAEPGVKWQLSMVDRYMFPSALPSPDMAVRRGLAWMHRTNGPDKLEYNRAASGPLPRQGTV